MWIIILALLLLGAQVNLSGLVPLQTEDPSPPWWVGGRLIWPFAEETNTLVTGDTLNTLTPLLSITSALCFLLAAAALLRWRVPDEWFPWLIIAGVVLSIMLQIIWFSGWSIFPLVVNIALLWALFGSHITVESLRGVTA
ncbi:MAG: hypothetical protein L0154_04180 [Chloroflexi bacterium]|nr:hypothetical protein [Chloroflexota bacterium]